MYVQSRALFYIFTIPPLLFSTSSKENLTIFHLRLKNKGKGIKTDWLSLCRLCNVYHLMEGVENDRRHNQNNSSQQITL